MMFGIGSLLQILGKITSSHGNVTTAERRSGSFKERLTPSGNRQVKVPFYGFMASVSVSLETHTYSIRLIGISLPQRVQGRPSFGTFNRSIFLLQELMISASSTVVQEIEVMKSDGLASLAFFYCDFKDDQKKDRRPLLSSLLVQLCDQSDAYSDVLSEFYSAHHRGSKAPSDDALTHCLKSMLRLPGQAPAFIVIDALDECSNTTSVPSPRDKVLGLVEELVDLQVPNLRICVTSRPEADIHPILDPLTFRFISLHDERGQMQDIADYIRHVVNTDPKMRRWKQEDKDQVIEALTKKADGM